MIAAYLRKGVPTGRSKVLISATMFLLICVTWPPKHSMAAWQGEDPVSLNVFPPTIELHGRRDFQKIVGQSVGHNGVTSDVTEELQIVVYDQSIAGLDGPTVIPLKTGETKLRIRHGELEVTVLLKLPPPMLTPRSVFNWTSCQCFPERVATMEAAMVPHAARMDLGFHCLDMIPMEITFD